MHSNVARKTGHTQESSSPKTTENLGPIQTSRWVKIENNVTKADKPNFNQLGRKQKQRPLTKRNNI